MESRSPKASQIHSAIVDVTDRCNLRCKHCFYFREEHESRELAGEEFLAGLRELRDRHDIQNMGWCGGEPLFRRELLEQGMELFPHNWLFTNGTLALPTDERLVVFVSIDGPPAIHDHIRGKGCHARIMENLGKRPRGRRVIFLSTLNAVNAPFLEEMVGQLAAVPDSAMMVQFFTPLRTYKAVPRYAHIEVQRSALDLTWKERDRLIERVFALKKQFPDFVWVRDRVLELMTSANAQGCVRRCNMPRRTLTLDLRLDRKLPCVLGRDVDCSKCGCIFPYEAQARREERASGAGAPPDLPPDPTGGDFPPAAA